MSELYGNNSGETAWSDELRGSHTQVFVSGVRESWEPTFFDLSQVYEGLRYRLSLEFPAGYPYQAPRVKFVTPCFHPNVDEQGFICLDILKDKWSALYDVRSILLSIQSLLGGKVFSVFYVRRSESLD